MAGEQARMAAIGLGLWGQNHALTYHKYHRSKLVVVCDMNEIRAREIAARYRCDYTTDYRELASADIDAVSVATPDPLHHAPVLAMVRAGKHVLVEKPFTTTVAEAQELVSARKKAGVKGMVDFQWRWVTNNILIKEQFLSGKMGEPVMAYARLSDAIRVAKDWLSWAGNSGPHWFLLPHSMDIVRWFFAQEPVEVYALARKGILSGQGIDTYDAMQALVQFSGNAFATFETNWVVPDAAPSVVDAAMAVYGTKGKAESDPDYNGLAITTDRHDFPWVPVGQTDLYGRLNSHIYEPIKHFVDCVLDDKAPTASFEDGLINTAMIAAAVRSVEERRPVKISELLG